MKMGQLIQLRSPARTEELSDEGLAAACATGDRAAQALLFDRHGDDVHRFISRMRGADASVVEDLVQQTFMAAYRSAARFRGAKIRSWLFGIATNLLRSHIRSEISRRRIVSELGDAHAQAPDVANPHDVELVKLRAAVMALAPKLREVLVLVDLEGETGIEVAEILGIPQSTVWRRLAQARQLVRTRLEGAP